MKKEKGIDDIFKHSLQDPLNEPEFAEHDWNAFEDMLDNNTGNGAKLLWLRYLGAAAAVVLVAFCWWMFKPAGVDAPNSLVKNNKGNSPIAIDSPGKEQPQNVPDYPIEKELLAKENGEKQTPSKSRGIPVNVVGNVDDTNQLRNKDKIESGGKTSDAIASTQPDNAVVDRGDNIIAAQPTIEINRPVDVVPADLSAGIPNKKMNIRPLSTNTINAVKNTGSSALRPQFALSVLASPEVNGIGSLRSGSRGTNVGMMFTIGINKFTLSTGANYTVKPYSVPYSQYPSSYSYRNTPETVTADCRMLDIPINLGYQVYSRSGNKITLGTGVSSYIMMHESYTYDYAAGTKVYGPSYYAVPGKGKYPFSIMNVQATYERQINSKFGLSLQPYYKIPLSAIGYSQVRVQTFGVALGLNWNINQLTKPK